MSSFDDPTEFPETAAVLGPTPSDNRSDAALAKSAAMGLGIVTTVGVDNLGLTKRSAARLTQLRSVWSDTPNSRDTTAMPWPSFTRWTAAA